MIIKPLLLGILYSILILSIASQIIELSVANNKKLSSLISQVSIDHQIIFVWKSLFRKPQVQIRTTPSQPLCHDETIVNITAFFTSEVNVITCALNMD